MILGAIASKHPMEWLWSVGSIKLQVSYASPIKETIFCKRDLNIILSILRAIASKYPIRTTSASNVANGSYCSKTSYLLNKYSLNMGSLSMYSLNVFNKYEFTEYVFTEYVFIEYVWVCMHWILFIKYQICILGICTDWICIRWICIHWMCIH